METISFDPTPLLPSPGPRPISLYQSQPRALSEDDMARLRQTILSRPLPEEADSEQMLMAHRDQAIAMLLISTGVTLVEVCALDTKDVQKDISGQFYLIAPRNRRVIPLETDTVKAVNRWLSLRWLRHQGQEFRPLFITRRHERIASVTVRTVLERLKTDSGVSFDPFALRHAFIRRMVKQGYSAQDISAMLGRPSHGVIHLYAEA